LIGAILTIVLCVFKAYSKNIAFRKVLIAAFASLAIVVGTTAVLPQSAHRVQMAMQDLHVTTNSAEGAAVAEVQTVSLSSTQLRLVTWQASWQILMTHPFGAGTGGVQKILDGLYLMEGETFAEEHHLNSHNQFLQTGAEHGWPGLTVLVILLFWLVRFTPISYELHVAQVFAILCGMNFLFESFLEVQAGIVFFSFWILIFAKIKRGL
jgi:O-antigen ligase